jgi:thioredoxin 1
MAKFSELINQDKAVLIDFFAEWCGPCKMMSPILKDVKDTLGDSITIIKIDVDKNQALASKYQVKGVPTLMLFKAGKQLWRQSGLLQKNEIIKTVEELTK